MYLSYYIVVEVNVASHRICLNCGNKKIFSDLDECLNGQLEDLSLCDEDKRCANTEGSYECVEACKSGYQPDVADAIGPCVDIDECLNNNHNCTLAEK